MAIPGLQNQWNFAGALQNLPNNMMERMSSIAMRVAIAAAAAQLGLWLTKMGISQVCPEGACQEPAVSRRETSLIDPESPPFGWEADPSKRETAFVDLAKPPFGWAADLKRETALVDLANPPMGWESPTQLCNPVPQSNFCKAFHAGMNYAEGIVSTTSKTAYTVLGNVSFLQYMVNGFAQLALVFKRIAHRGP